jgi:Ig-like domain from next to BRCA1 gene
MPLYIHQLVKPEDFVQVVLEFVAPSKAGKYHAFFRLMHKENIEFGEKVFVDLEVIDKPKEVAQIAIKEEVIVPQAEPVINTDKEVAT